MKENLVYELNEVMRELGANGQTILAIRHSLDNKMEDDIPELCGEYTRAEELRENLIHFARLHDEIHYMFDKLQKEVNRHE